MIVLGNGNIYLNEGEPLPFSCPQCGNPVAFTQKLTVQCPKCHLLAPRESFGESQWQFMEPN